MSSNENSIGVLFVCLGNICRSPLAQGIFEKKIKEKNWEGKIFTDSAGTSGWHQNEPPHHASVAVAKENGIDISKQRGRSVTHSDNQSFHYFIPMDENNCESLLDQYELPKEKVIKIREFDPHDKGADVPDPYGKGAGAFENVFRMLDVCMDAFLSFLEEKHPDFFTK